MSRVVERCVTFVSPVAVVAGLGFIAVAGRGRVRRVSGPARHRTGTTAGRASRIGTAGVPEGVLEPELPVPPPLPVCAADQNGVTHRFHPGCHAVWVSELRKRRVLRRQLSPLDRVTIQLSSWVRGAAYLASRLRRSLEPDAIDALIAELELVVQLVRAQDLCPV